LKEISKKLLLFSIILFLVLGVVSGYNSPSEEIYKPFFNETSSSTLFDYSGNGFDSTSIGSGVTQGVDGPKNFNDDLAYSFNGGPDGLVTVSDQPEFSILESGDRAAVCLWIKADNESSTTNAFGVDKEWHVHPDDQSPGNSKIAPRFDTFGDNNLDEVSDTLSVNEWEHLCYNINAGNYIETWQNANLMGNTTDITDTSSDGASATKELFIGGNPKSGDFFEGEIDEARIFNRMLTSTEINNIYTNNELTEKSVSYSPSISNPDPSNKSKGIDLDKNLSVLIEDKNTAVLNATFSLNGTIIENVTSISNGTRASVNPENLENNSEYQWKVNATDGENNTIKYYTFYTSLDSDGQPISINNILNYNSTSNSVTKYDDFLSANDKYTEIFQPPDTSGSSVTGSGKWWGNAGSITKYNSSTYIASHRERWPEDAGGNLSIATAPSSNITDWTNQCTVTDEEAGGDSFEQSSIRMFGNQINLYLSHNTGSQWNVYRVTGDSVGSLCSNLKTSNTEWQEIFLDHKDPKVGIYNSTHYYIYMKEGSNSGTPDLEVIVDDNPSFSSPTNGYSGFEDDYASQFGAGTSDSNQNTGEIIYDNSSDKYIVWNSIRDDWDADSTQNDIIWYYHTCDSLTGSCTLRNRELAVANWSDLNSNARYFDYYSLNQDEFLLSMEWDNDNDGQNKSMVLWDYRADSTSDSTPPTSTDNWTASGFVDKSSVTVRLNASDNQGGSGVANISYRVNGGSYTTVSGNETDVVINTQGNNTLEYYATDNAGNQESVNTEYVALGKTYVQLNSSVQINQTSNNVQINVTDSFNVSNLTVYDDATNFGGINWSINGDTNDFIDVRLSWFNDNNTDDTYLANYSLANGIGTSITSSFVPRPVDSVYQVTKNGSFFKQVQSDTNSLLDFGYEVQTTDFVPFTVKRTDQFRPEFNSSTFVYDEPGGVERMSFVLWTRGENDIASSTGIGTRTELTNTSMKYDVSLPISGTYTITDVPGLKHNREVDLSKSESGVVENSSFSHDLSVQEQVQELNLTNGDVPAVNYTWKTTLGSSITGQVARSSTATLTDSKQSDNIVNNSYGFNIQDSEIVLGFNYTAVTPLELNNTAVNQFTGVSTTGGYSSVFKCSTINNTEVDIAGDTVKNFSVGRQCNPGNVGTPTQTITNDSVADERIWYNSTDMVINTNKTSNTDIVIRADKSNLKNPDKRDANSLDAIVEGVKASNTDSLNVSDTGSFFRVTVGDIQNSTLYTDDSDWSVTYTLSGDNTTIIDDGGGGGGGAGPTTEEQTIYFGQSQTQDGLETFSVPFNSTSVRNLTITNPSQESLTAELVVGTGGVCDYVSVRPSLTSDQWRGSGSYSVPAASPNQLGTIQDATVDTQIRFDLPARSQLESQGINEFRCEFQTASSYGVAEPLVAVVQAPLSLSGILDSLGLGQELCVKVPYATLEGGSDPREICQPLAVWLFLAALVVVLFYLLYLAWRGKI